MLSKCGVVYLLILIINNNLSILEYQFHLIDFKVIYLKL